MDHFIFIVAKCAIDHPHHVLPKIFALANAFKDENSVLNRETMNSSPRTDSSRILLQQLKTNSKLGRIIEQWENMSDGKNSISF